MAGKESSPPPPPRPLSLSAVPLRPPPPPAFPVDPKNVAVSTSPPPSQPAQASRSRAKNTDTEATGDPFCGTRKIRLFCRRGMLLGLCAGFVATADWSEWRDERLPGVFRGIFMRESFSNFCDGKCKRGARNGDVEYINALSVA